MGKKVTARIGDTIEVKAGQYVFLIRPHLHPTGAWLEISTPGGVPLAVTGEESEWRVWPTDESGYRTVRVVQLCDAVAWRAHRTLQDWTQQ